MTERGDGRRRGAFDQVVERASNFASSPTIFASCLVLVVAWATSYALGFGSIVHHLLGESMAAVTLLDEV